MRDYYRYTRVCIDCGAVMHHVGQNTKRCPACRRCAEKEGKARDKLRHRQADAVRRRTLQQEKRDLELNAMVREAGRMGMSYGQYVARQRLARQAAEQIRP